MRVQGRRENGGEELAGHVFVLRGDVRRLSCDAWVIPCDGEGRCQPSWLAWPPGADRQVPAPTPFPHWTQEASRARRLEGWPQGLPEPWLLHVEPAPQVPRSWLVEAVLAFVEGAAGRVRKGPRRRSAPLLAIPLGVAGIGAAELPAARRAAGGLARELLPELRQAARRLKVDIALVSHADDSHAAAQAARLQADPRPPELPEKLLAALGPLTAARRQGRLALVVGPALGWREGLPSWEALLEHVAESQGASAAWRGALGQVDRVERTRQLVGRLGGTAPLTRAIQEQLVRHHMGLGHGLLASLGADPVLVTGPDDLVEQALGAAGHPADVLLDGPSCPGGPRLFSTYGSARRPAQVLSSWLDPSRLRERERCLSVAAQASLGAGAHLLFVGFPPGPELLQCLNLLLPVLGAGPEAPAGAAARVTVLAETDDPAWAELWPPELLTWLPLVEGGAPDSGEHQRLRQLAGRRLELLLDWLGAEVATAGRGLDPELRALLPEADQALARALDELLARLPARAREARAWPALAGWLLGQGHPDPRGGR